MKRTCSMKANKAGVYPFSALLQMPTDNICKNCTPSQRFTARMATYCL